MAFRCLRLFAGALALCGAAGAQAAVCTQPWALWERFAERWLQADGRVLESSLEKNHSTSEGQSYALFFALVANDRTRFEQIWRWSRENLLGDDPHNNLPAWLWGQGKDGKWQVQDANAASDADLWFVYALLEAARLWNKPEYQADALLLLEQVRLQETTVLPGLGPVLLPGPVGFAHADQLWQINPSYQPLPVMRRLAAVDPRGPWAAIAANTPRLIDEAGGHGFAADWVGYRSVSEHSGLFTSDPLRGDNGSYDAIRVYLWAGMTHPDDPLAGPLLGSLGGMARATASSGIPPEKVDVRSGVVSGEGGSGFSAALVPYFRAKQQPYLEKLQYQRAMKALEEWQTGDAEAPLYYHYMLSLFGLGWADGFYSFTANGQLQPFWESPCSDTAP
jgi:endo-1,4-beta-D-glucanase Y